MGNKFTVLRIGFQKIKPKGSQYIFYLPGIYRVHLLDRFLKVKFLFFTIKRIEYSQIIDLQPNAFGNWHAIEITYKKNNKKKVLSLYHYMVIGEESQYQLWNSLRNKTNVFKNTKHHNPSKNVKVFKQFFL